MRRNAVGVGCGAMSTTSNMRSLAYDIPQRRWCGTKWRWRRAQPNAAGANPGAAHVGKAAEAAEYFADDSSWGYRLAGRMEFNNAIGAIALLPRFSWQHDVGGVSPGPGGNFIEGRQALTIGLLGVYQNVWSGDLSYTRYMGAGRHNLINDRDFIAANVKYSF